MTRDKEAKKAALAKKLEELENKAKALKDKKLSLKKQLADLDKPGANLTSKQQTMVKILYGDACLELCKIDADFAERVRRFLDEKTKGRNYRRLLGLPTLNEEKRPEETQKQMEKTLLGDNPVFARERIALTAMFEEKEQVKALGATWDGKTWGVPAGMDLRPFAKWLPAGRNWSTYGLV